ncbi:ExbD/TolR family protein [Jejuia pallidilutea]|uniref:Biopolymer transport ExbD protein n=1 Tax=Jejuia pallidilutea TaxID=504487 RepID=A0A090VQY7_9FLAO|nr:biopolymer transporter ExbD [Jejuia pallidilutea]GAL67150.1 biopolymer transport ExbD protein [Jejuia pallidilutea]GAL73110.1 biopolymer transport ExbD protein [Jejuia pallidilutea]GAL90704.1 biopolymer transport exbD protein [Jejuia pallidilutea]
MRPAKAHPEVNAGSMADIAFLLLIFFLVTAVIPKDQGIYRKLPKECPPGQDCNIPIPDRNILKIAINANNEIMVDDAVVSVSEVKALAKNFIDNNGDGSFAYCNGSKTNTSSDNPTKAVISLQSDRSTNYNQFIEVQDELTKAYFELRKTYSESVLKKPIDKLTEQEILRLKNAYPFILSEAETR